MKICPKCKRNYQDASLNFCLDDGSALQFTTAGDLPQTVMMVQDPTARQQTPITTGRGGQTSWNTPPTRSKGSRTWLGVLLIIGAVMLICGGGGIGFLAYIGSQIDNDNTTTNSNLRQNRNTNWSNSQSANTSTVDPSDPTRNKLQTFDLSRWVQTGSVAGNTEFTDGIFQMSSKQKDYFYALNAKESDTTVGANTSVIVKNLTNGETNLGYGLVFHSNPKPLQQGYAFVIDAKKKRYRIVRHTPGNEFPVINWTRSDAVKDGVQENKLEVRDQGESIDLYINGVKVNTIQNQYGYSKGVVGLYAGDALPIGFKDLQIRR